MSVVKRFIAGAVCPRCGKMDRLQMYTLEASTYKECVECGYIEKQVEETEQDELATRVNQEKEFVHDTSSETEEVSTIKFYPKMPKTKH